MVEYHRSESFIHFSYFEAISLVKTKKNRGAGLSPPGKNKNRNQFLFLSFGVDPLNWQSFIEIGEMTCSTTAWCSRRHALNTSDYAMQICIILQPPSARQLSNVFFNENCISHFMF